MNASTQKFSVAGCLDGGLGNGGFSIVLMVAR
jgi:hypothetical protein